MIKEISRKNRVRSPYHLLNHQCWIILPTEHRLWCQKRTSLEYIHQFGDESSSSSIRSCNQACLSWGMASKEDGWSRLKGSTFVSRCGMKLYIESPPSSIGSNWRLLNSGRSISALNEFLASTSNASWTSPRTRDRCVTVGSMVRTVANQLYESGMDSQ